MSGSQTSIKAYVNHAGRQGNVEIEAMWNTQGNINLILQLQMVCYSLQLKMFYTCIVELIPYILQTNNKCFR